MSEKPFFRSGYDPRIRSRDPAYQTPAGGESMTKQAFKKECDINNIVSKYLKSGYVGHLNPKTPRYGYAPAVDLHEALAIVDQAFESFARLPADVRKRFANDPMEFAAFLDKPEAPEELRKLRLLKPEESSSLQEKGAESAGSEPQASDNPPDAESPA